MVFCDVLCWREAGEEVCINKPGTCGVLTALPFVPDRPVIALLAIEDNASRLVDEICC